MSSSESDICNNDSLKQMENSLKLNDDNITLFTINGTHFDFMNKEINLKIKCIKFCVQFAFEESDLNIVMEIITPCNKPTADHTQNLRIYLKSEEIQKEIISCINYLQRQRNPILATLLLKKCANLIEQRKAIITILTEKCPTLFKAEHLEDGEVIIKSVNPDTNFCFFQSTWKIDFSCHNHEVFDWLDFTVNCKDDIFYNDVRFSMSTLANRNVPLTVKINLWTKIVKAVINCNKRLQGTTFLSSQTSTVSICSSNSAETENTFNTSDSPQVTDVEINLSHNNTIAEETVEVSDSDDDQSCIVID